jgi:non-ribosomal peptide synthetase component F
VHRQVRLHLEQKDWRGLTQRYQQDRWNAYLHAERRRGFELSVPPLMRLALFHAGAAKHILAWTFHQLLLDSRAVVVLLHEVFQFYEAICEGRDLKLPEPRPYREYIDWLRKRNRSDTEAFWRNQLNGFTTPTPLVVARAVNEARAQQAGYNVQQVTLSRRQTGNLQLTAMENGLTVNTLLQGAWAVLLARYSGAEDVVFGVVRACRRSSVEGAESIVGLLVNTLPMRVRVKGKTRVRDWLKGLRAQELAIRDHEHASLVDVQRWCGLPSVQPLFESVFHFQDPPWDAALRALGGKWANREFSIRSQPSFPLRVDVHGGPELTLKLGYDQGRFQDSTVARILGHFQAVLIEMADDLSRRVADLPLLADAEQRQILIEWNDTETDFPRDKCVHELFETQVERTPNAVALVYTKEEVSYRELDNQANRVAHHLRSLDVGPDVPVGICMQRSTDMVVGLLGILKAGGAYVLLDPAYPKERLMGMLADGGAPVLLTQSVLKDRFQFQMPHGRVVCLESLRQTAGKERHASAPRTKVSPDHLAYVIYRSGSTGAPKRVELSHRVLVNLLSWHQRAYRVSPQDRTTQLAGLSFDASVWELWPYLTAGASVHIVDDERRAPASNLGSFNIHLSIRSLFEKPTVAEFSKEIQRRTMRPAPQCWPGLTRVSREPYRLNSLSSNAGTTTANYN